MTPFKVNCPETKQNRKTIFPMTLNTIDDTSFPTHSDTHFLCKCVENLTPFQIKLSRNKEKQTDNIQTTLFLFFTSTKLLVPKLSKTKRQEPKCPYLTICPETK